VMPRYREVDRARGGLCEQRSDPARVERFVWQMSHIKLARHLTLTHLRLSTTIVVTATPDHLTTKVAVANRARYHPTCTTRC